MRTGEIVIFRITGAALLSLLLLASRSAEADEYPSRKVTLVVATAPGGYADSVTRIVAERLAERYRQTFVVENRGGAGGNVGAKSVLDANADGYTILVTTTQLAINETLYKNTGFSARAFSPISIPVSAPEVIVANPSNPAQNLADLLKSAGDAPLTYGSAGTGTGSHIEAEYLFTKLAKIRTIHVPFSGGAPAINDLLGDHIHVLAITVSPIISAINQGTIRGLGIATPKRMSFVPSVPTFAENGFPNYYAASWVGFFAAAKTPNDVVEKLNSSISDVLKNQEVRRRLEPFGVQLIDTTAKDTAVFFQAEMDRWGKMVRSLDLSVN
jgi:tripartite-type tricarboxylate transporter receptor subunit TctC